MKKTITVVLERTTLLFSLAIFLSCLAQKSSAQTSCEADHNVLLTDFSFTPETLVILPGESVAFINVQGIHSVNGVNSTTSGESFNNPVEFYFPESEGTTEGTCMGVVTFDVPGIYNFDCDIGFHAELGMVGSVIVDAYTISDLLASGQIPETFQSSYAMNLYYSNTIDPDAISDINLNGNQPYTIFLPNDPAVNAILDDFGDPELSQSDLLGFIDLPAALGYNIVEGLFMAEDLQDGQLLPTTYGQDLLISEVNGSFMVDDAAIVSTNYTADNGVVHIIDKTLAPSGLPAMSVWNIIEDSENHQFFEDALIATGFKTILRKQSEMVGNSQSPQGPFTVFAPTDEALEAFSEAANLTQNELLASSLIDDLVAHHILNNEYESANISNNQLFPNFNDEFLLMTVNDGNLFVDGIAITITDVLAYNGVVHVIDAVLPIDFPSTNGTCGVWTLNMYDSDADGWESTELYVEVDGEIISVENGPVGESSSLEFGVNFGDIVNLYYISTGPSSGQYYSIIDGENQQIAVSGLNNSPVSSIGLFACPETPSCGILEIVMTHEFEEGWANNQLQVVKNGELFLSIPFYFGSEQTTLIQADDGDIYDFVYEGGQSFDPQYEGYKIFGPDGSMLVNQDISEQIPESTFGLTTCEVDLSIEELIVEAINVYPNPTNGLINIKLSDEFYKSDIQLIDINGKIIASWQSFTNSQLDLSDFAQGVYILEFQGRTEVGRKRLVIE